MLGQTVSHFEVQQKLGEGGMGAVYKARDTRLERVVALKFLSSRLGDSPEARERFLREGRALSALSHPHVATVYEVDEADGLPFLALEYLPGGTLRSKIAAAQGRLPVVGVLQWAIELAEGLAHVHKNGVVHRDIKSSNVMFDAEDRIKLTDFGLALKPSTDESSHTSAAVGTVGYMAPEQLQGSRASRRSDLFSFGVVLYEAATGTRPFAGNSAGEIVTKTLTANPIPVTTLRPELPEGFGSVIGRLLRKVPTDRYETADDVARDLRALSGEVRDAPSTVTLAPAGARSRWSRRWWIAAAIPVAAAAYLGWRPGATRPSIAVIPFVNVQRPSGSDYLSDGISETLIDALARVPELKVIARSSSFKFNGAHIDLHQAARKLGVQLLVTGRVAETDKRLRITVDLIDGSTGKPVWGSEYTSTASDLPAVEAAIARDVGERARHRRTEIEQAKQGKSTKVNPEAYELLLRGRYYQRLHTPYDSMRAVSYFQQAIALDSGFALAHAELAHVYRLLGGSAILSAQDTMGKAEAEARRALALDPGLAEAHAVLGDIQKDRWDWSGAELEYRRAIELSPNLAAARNGFAIYLSITGRFDQAIAEAQTARELDPLGVPTAVIEAAVYYNARQYDQALARLKRALELDPSAAAAWTWIGIVNGGTHQFARATDAYEKAIALGDDTTATQCYYAYSLAQSGRREEALRILQKLHRPGAFVSGAALAATYLGLGQRDRALQELEAAYTGRDPLLQYLKVESHFDSLRSEHRFQQICTKVGLPH